MKPLPQTSHQQLTHLANSVSSYCEVCGKGFTICGSIEKHLKKNLVWYNYCFGVSQYCKKNLKLLPQTSQTELIPVVKFVEKDLQSVEVRIILLSVNFLLKGVFFSVNYKQNTWL